MVRIDQRSTQPEPQETREVERQARRAREAEGIARAQRSAAAGRVVSSDAVDAWIDSLGTEDELASPRSGR